MNRYNDFRPRSSTCVLLHLQDSMTSFSISEDGQLYSALTSNNTCALLDVGVSQGKAAWEFLLEDDSPRYANSLRNYLGMCRAYIFDEKLCLGMHQTPIASIHGSELPRLRQLSCGGKLAMSTGDTKRGRKKTCKMLVNL